jgi:hypothetical protein
MYQGVEIHFFATNLLRQVKTRHIRIGIVGEKYSEPSLGQYLVLVIVHILACVLGNDQ